MIASAVLLGGLAIPAYSLASNGTMGDRLIAQLMLAIGAVTANVVTAALLCEVFLTRVRCTASAVTYNVSYAIFGGIVPFVATYLIAVTANRLAPAIYIAVIVLFAFAVSLLTPETAGRVFHGDPIPGMGTKPVLSQVASQTWRKFGLSGESG